VEGVLFALRARGCGLALSAMGHGRFAECAPTGDSTHGESRTRCWFPHPERRVMRSQRAGDSAAAAAGVHRPCERCPKKRLSGTFSSLARRSLWIISGRT